MTKSATRAALHTIVAVLSTLPLIWHLGTRIPLGRERVATVPLFNLWSLIWTADRAPHLLTGWWDAPIFWLAKGAYTYSELQPLTGFVFAALRVVLTDTASYDVILIAALALNGITAAKLARRLGVAEVPAALAGILAQTIPFLFAELGVLQLVMLWPVLFVLDQLLAWASNPKLRHAAGIGAGIAVSFLTCGYYTVLLVLCSGACVVLLAERGWIEQWRRRLLSVVVVGAALVPCIPFAVGQQHRIRTHRWADETIRFGSATWSELGIGGRHWAGSAVVLLAAVGVAHGVRRREVRFLTALAVVAMLVALGTRLSVFGFHPYELLVHNIGVFSRLRSPFRAIAITQVALAVLAALGLDALWRWRPPATGAIVATLAVVAVVATADLGAGALVSVPERQTAWIDYLQDHPGGAVVMLPAAEGPEVEDFEPTTAAMMQGLVHGHPLVNGYSGFFPEGDREFRHRLAEFPDDETLSALRRRGTRYAVDDAWWTPERAAAARALHVREVVADRDGALLDLGA